MRRVIPALMVATLTLTACGGFRDSNFNPRNWFGRSTSVPVAVEERNALIPARSGIARPEVVYRGTRVDQVTDLAIERTPGGALVRATGVATRQGAYDVRLVPLGSPDNGVLSYELQVLYPRERTLQGPEQSRTVTVANALTDQQLDGVRTIRVIGARNERTSTRR